MPRPTLMEFGVAPSALEIPAMPQNGQLIINYRYERPPLRLLHNPDARATNSVSARLSVTSELASIEHEYRGFEERADCTPFQTFDWLATWQRCIGAPAGIKPAIVTATQRNGQLLFILPLAIEPSRFNRRLVFLGHAICDYNAPLLSPDFTDLVKASEFLVWWRAIRDLLQRTPGYQHDVIVLDKLPERIGRQANPLLALPTMLNPSAAYRTRLGDDWDTFYAQKRSSERRRRDRARRRKLAEIGELRFITPKHPEEIQATLTSLFMQKSRSFAQMGVPDLFGRPGHLEFFRAVSTQANRLVHVSRLEVGPNCAAVTFGLIFRGCFYQIIVSYDEQFSRFGPGTAQLHEVMRYCVAQGLEQYDFTIGDEPFKLDWSDEMLILHDHIAATSYRGWISFAQIILKSRAKRFIKHSPLLLALVVRLRSLRNAIMSAMHRRAVA